ncbi:MAG: starch-binding protein [Muribaculaceae bacterium]|nr:starch-binding protein [Muribaculaceae bacterium]
MKKIYITIAMALLLPLTTLAQGWPANYGGVMLQGFFWDSYKPQWDGYETLNCPHGDQYTWATMYGADWGDNDHWEVPITTWNSLMAHKDEITPYIDIIWLPQSGSTVCPPTTPFPETEESKPNWDGSRHYVDRAWRHDQGGNYRTYVGNDITNPDCMGFVPVFYFHHGLCKNPDGSDWTYNYNHDNTTTTYTPFSYFGTEQELRNLISAFKADGTGAIEDVVANHRGGLGTWSGDDKSIDFPTEWYKGTYCPQGEFISWDKYDVCIDDESGKGAGNPDCGGDNGKGKWARDIDHHSPTTQAKVIKFLDYLKNDLGYVGFRYDYAMGFEEKHFAEYNTTLRPTFSVGEYWGSQDNISSWVHNTYEEGTYQSAAFDFPLMYAINDAFNNGNYRGLNDAGLIGNPMMRRYVVTFVDNHDTFKDLPTDDSNRNYANRTNHNILEANAFILAMPGTPCLFWPHFMNTNWYPHIVKMIKARRIAGVTNESNRSAAEFPGNNGIQWIITGNNGQICFQLGDAVSQGTPSGFTSVWESSIARFSITSELYSQVVDENYKKTDLINGYPVIDKMSCTFDESIDVNVSPSSEDCELVFTTNGTDPKAGYNTITNSKSFTFTENTTLKVGVVVNGQVPSSSIVTRKYVKTNTTSDKINIYVNAENTEAPNLYIWYVDGNGNKIEPNGAWAGCKTTETVTVGSLTWHHYSMDDPGDGVSMIINWNGGNQSHNIYNIKGEKFYTYINGVVNDVTTTYLPMMENPELAIDKATGTYEGSVKATITSTYSGAKIVYTADEVGTEPTATSEQIASGSTVTFNETGNHYLRAGILKDGEVINQVARSYNVTNGTGSVTPPSDVEIYVYSPWAPRLHAWLSDNTNINGAWGDNQQIMTQTATTPDGKTWYKWTTNYTNFKMKLHNEASGGGQTQEIPINGAGKYYFVYNTYNYIEDIGQFDASSYKDVSLFYNSLDPITIYVKADAAPNLYVWKKDGDFVAKYNGNFVGNQMEKGTPVHMTNDGNEWYEFKVTGPNAVNIILSHDGSQTSDINGVSGIRYYNYNGGTSAEDVTSQYTTESTIPSCATTMDNCQYIYFENGSFGSPYAWVYSGTKTFCEHGWPGEPLIEAVGTAPNGNLVYRWTYNGTSPNPSDVIFSNNGRSQVGPFAFVNGGYYTSEGLQGTATGNIKTLAEVLKNGEVNQNYTISNDIVAVYTDQKGYKHIFAKDADGEALDLSTNPGGKKIHPTMTDWTYDQSNWVEIVLPAQLNSNNLQLFDDKSLLGQTIVGKLVDKVNPRIEVVANPLPTSKETGYNENQYVAANFMPADYTPNAGYFLVAPKPQEHAIIHWAVYEGNGIFTMPEKNAAGTLDVVIKGKFALAAEQPYFDMANTTIAQTLQVGHVYDLDVIVKRKITRQGAPRLMEESDVSNIWEVAVVMVKETAPDVTTPISTVDAGREVAKVRYYNLMGVESNRPFKGVNIIVKEYTDGTRSTTKVIR